MKLTNVSVLIIRYALAITFLSAVADRFGFWGSPGEANVAWGNFSNFLDYTGILNPWAPKSMLPIIGGITTILEIFLAIALIIGFRVKEISLFSAILLLVFAVSMTLTLGIKTPLDYSVFSASAGAFLLYSVIKENDKGNVLIK